MNPHRSPRSIYLMQRAVETAATRVLMLEGHNSGRVLPTFRLIRDGYDRIARLTNRPATHIDPVDTLGLERARRR